MRRKLKTIAHSFAYMDTAIERMILGDTPTPGARATLLLETDPSRSYTSIATEVGCSRQRVHQLARKLDLTRDARPIAAAAFQKKQAIQKADQRDHNGRIWLIRIRRRLREQNLHLCFDCKLVFSLEDMAKPSKNRNPRRCRLCANRLASAWRASPAGLKAIALRKINPEKARQACQRYRAKKRGTFMANQPPSIDTRRQSTQTVGKSASQQRGSG